MDAGCLAPRPPATGTTLLYHTSTTRIRRNFPYLTSISIDMYGLYRSSSHLRNPSVLQGRHYGAAGEVPWVHGSYDKSLLVSCTVTASGHVHCCVDALHAGRGSESLPKRLRPHREVGASLLVQRQRKHSAGTLQYRSLLVHTALVGLAILLAHPCCPGQ